MAFQLYRKQDQAVVMSEGKVADTYFPRLIGLIGKKQFPAGEGVFFPKCNSVHMWMMSIPIDVIFLKSNTRAEWTVVSLHRALKPWKLLPVTCFSANDVLELPVGTIDRLGLKTGEVLCTVS
jgi:uncharacterized membrane protein (UPF0127 family)